MKWYVFVDLGLKEVARKGVGWNPRSIGYKTIGNQDTITLG